MACPSFECVAAKVERSGCYLPSSTSCPKSAECHCQVSGYADVRSEFTLNSMREGDSAARRFPAAHRENRYYDSVASVSLLEIVLSVQTPTRSGDMPPLDKRQ